MSSSLSLDPVVVPPDVGVTAGRYDRYLLQDVKPPSAPSGPAAAGGQQHFITEEMARDVRPERSAWT